MSFAHPIVRERLRELAGRPAGRQISCRHGLDERDTVRPSPMDRFSPSVPLRPRQVAQISKTGPSSAAQSITTTFKPFCSKLLQGFGRRFLRHTIKVTYLTDT